MRKKFLSLIFFLGFATLAHAQVLPFEYYSAKDGLSSNWVTSVMQDARGYLWISGDEGIAKYDGVRFTNYGVAAGLPVSHIWRVYEGPRSPGTIWIGTTNNSVWKLVEGKFSRMKTDRPINTATYFLEDHEGIVWCGTTKGVYQVRGDSLVFFSAIRDTAWAPFIVQTRDSSIWIGMWTSLYRYSPQTRLTTSLNLPTPIGFTCMLEDSAGNIWLGDSRGTVHLWRNGGIVASRQISFKEVHDARSLNAVADDGEGNLWFATSAGIIKIAKQNFPHGNVIRYTTANGLRDIDITSSQRDREGNLWFGSRAEGLIKLSDRQVFRFPLAGLRPDLMNHAAVTDSRGRIFVSAETGVWEIWRNAGGDWNTHLHQLDHGNLSGRNWQAFIDRDSTFWLSFVNGGLAGYRIKAAGDNASTLLRTRLLRPGREISSGFPLAFLIDEHRQLWCSLRDSSGAVHFDLNTSTQRAFYKTASGMPWGTIRAIMRESEDRLWFGGFENGIAIFDLVGDTLRLARKVTKVEGLSDNQIRYIGQRRNGEVWIGTRFGGITIYHRGNFETLSTKHGLFSDAVWGFAEDDSGRVWIASSGGIQMTAAADSRALVTIPELRGEYFGSIGIAPDNLVWATGYKELVVYDFGRPRAAIAPLVYLTDFYVKGEKRPLVAAAEYAHDENSCAVNFIGLSFKNEKAVRYRYRLRGLDEDWQGPITEQTARFAALPAGVYTFEVVALSAEGIASAPAAFTFTILSPFWLRWWFIALGLIVLAGILYAIHIVRLDRVLEIEKIRARIATDLHDDIGAGLTHIGLLSQVALQKKNSGELDSAMERVGNIARELSAAMSDVVWSVNPQHDSMLALQRRLRIFAQEICEARGIKLNLEVAEAVAGVKLHPEIRRNLLLIGKEALHNTVKYSGSPSFSVKFLLEQKNILMEIIDAGKGFDAAQAKNGNGLNNMRTRAEKLGGKFELLSISGQGTRIEVRLPLKN